MSLLNSLQTASMRQSSAAVRGQLTRMSHNHALESRRGVRASALPPSFGSARRRRGLSILLSSHLTHSAVPPKDWNAVCEICALRTRGRCRQTLRRRCSRAQRSRTCARGRRVRWNHRAGGCAMVAQYIAELSDAAHQHRGMRGFLPEGYPPEGHRPHEPGLPESRMPGPRTESRARVKLNEVPTKSGDVVQLVRTPACHVGGRGFEPRRPRQSTHLNFTKSEPLRISNTLVRG